MYGDNYEAMFNHKDKVNGKGVVNTPLQHHVNTQQVKTISFEDKLEI